MMLSKDEQKEILKLRTSGMSIVNIGKQMKRGKHTVGKFIKDPQAYAKIAEEMLNKKLQSSRKNGTTDIKSKSRPKPKPKQQNDSIQTNGHQFQRFNYIKTPSKKGQVNEEAYNSVIVEHRAIIKYFTKTGLTAKETRDNLLKVYGKGLTPDYNAVAFWHRQYAQGRETIINDSSRPNGSSHKTPLTTSSKSTLKQKHQSGIKLQKKKAVKRLQPQKPKAPEKKLFQIKLSNLRILK